LQQKGTKGTHFTQQNVTSRVARDAEQAYGCAEDLEQRLLERGTHDVSLPLPGETVHADFRDPAASAQAWAEIAAGRPVRVVQWNIERGLEFNEILSTLQRLQADVLLVQEVDIGCDRTQGRDVGAFWSLLIVLMKILQVTALSLAKGCVACCLHNQ
jgi:hypothetical protein